MLQYTGKWFFEFLYAINKVPIIARITCLLIAPFIKKYLEDVIIKEQPDKIVIFHFFLIIPVFKILRKKNLSIPVITVITDPFTPHTMFGSWWRIRISLSFSKELERKVFKKRRGYQAHYFLLWLMISFLIHYQVMKYLQLKGIWIWSEEKDAAHFRRRRRYSQGEKILEELLKSNVYSEIGIVCGKNEVLQKGAET